MRNVAIRTLRIDLRASFTIGRSCCRDISPPRITRTRFAASATKDPETGKRLLFISNNTALPALSICALYKARWQVADLDRRVGLRARRHHQEAPKPVSQPVRNATDFEPQPVRENLAGYSAFAYSDGLRISSRRQTADSALKTLGQA